MAIGPPRGVERGLGGINLPVHAAGPGTGTCASSTAPAPGSGATQVGLPDGGTVSQWGDPTGGGVEISGPHGYLAATGSPSGGGNISGYSTDQGNLNGSLAGSTAGNVSLCLGVNGQTVTAP